MIREILLLNGSSIHEREFRGILPLLEGIFNAAASVKRATLDLRRAYDESRKQNNSTALLMQLLNHQLPPSQKAIAIVDVDLFIPILTFVFGEAQLGGNAAVVSTHRLHNQFYGMAKNPLLLFERLEKEIVHELGHTFGLLHCRQFECVMRSSTYVEEIDMKRVFPCPDCAAILSGSE